MGQKQSLYEISYEMQQRRKEKITFSLGMLLGVFVLLSLVLNFILVPVHVKSGSMEKNIAKGGAVYVCPLFKTPSRGDVFYISRMDGYKNSFFKNFADVVVRFFTLQKISPFGKSEHISGCDFIRRVLAVPGDTIYMKDFVIYIKPKGEKLFLTEFELSAKAYDVQIFSTPAEWNNVGISGDLDELVLGENEYFVLADNRVECLDSRQWGCITGDRLKGRVIVQYFPLNRLKLF